MPTNYELVADQLYKDKPTLEAVPALAERQPTAPNPTQSPYDAVADRMVADTDSRLRSSVFGASSANPDQAARAKTVAQRIGIPQDVAERNAPDAERQALIQDVDEGTAGSRVLRNAFSDPYFAKVGKDDVPALSRIEKAVRQLLDPTSRTTPKTEVRVGTSADFTKRVLDIAKATPSIGMDEARALAAQRMEVDNTPGGIRASERPDVNILNLAKGVFTRLQEGLQKANAGMTLAAGDVLGIDNSALAKKQFDQAAFRSYLNSPEPDSWLGQQIYAGVTSTVQQAPGLALLVASGSPLPWMASAYFSTAPQVYAEVRNRGGSPFEATLSSTLQGGLEIATEYLPSKFLMDRLGKMGAGDFLRGYLGRDLWTEQVNTLLSNAVDTAIANPNKTWGQYLLEQPEAMLATAVQTLVQGGILTGVNTGLSKTLMRDAANSARADEALTHANQLGELFNIAAGSNLRGRDADSFAAFAQQVVEDSGSSNGSVYVDGAKLVEVLNQAKIDMATFSQMSPTAAAALEDAAASGGSVSIPIADLIGKMGDSGIEKNLLPHLRANEDALSQEEAQFEQAAAVQVLQQHSERVIEQAQESAVIEQSAEKVRTIMMGQLTTAGRFTPDVNRAYSTLVGSFYTVLGNQLGVTPEQAYAAYPLQVEGVTPKGEVLNKGIDDQMAERIDADYGAAVAEYNALPDTDGGRVVNTDLARELSPEYRADRTRSAEVHTAASAFAKRRYADLLAGPVATGRLPFVLMTGGGAGAGKSSGLRATGAESLSNPDVTLDATLSVFSKAAEQIDQALSSGREVRIAYTYRDPVDAFVKGALTRAMSKGRTVPLGTFIKGHVGSRATIEQLMEKYADNPRVQFTVIDNSRGANKAAVTTIDALPQVDETDLGNKLYEALQQELQAGRISEAVAAAVAAATASETVATDSRPARPGTGQGLEQATPESLTAAPLAGLPAIVDIDGRRVTFGPSTVARQAAQDYADQAGFPYAPPTQYVRVDPVRAASIAQAYEEMADAPNDPDVRAAYGAMIAETLAQYEVLLATGLKVEFNVGGVDPYGNPRNAILDVVDNNHLFIFPTEDGYGESGITPELEALNPMLAPSGYEFGGKPARVNDVFRAVHGYFGHVKEGVGFRADGEENAWRAHWAMFTPLARKALTTETRGQNSWVNFGPHAEANKTASGGDTVYAPQKVGLLPQWVVDEGAQDDNAEVARAAAQQRRIADVMDNTFNQTGRAEGDTKYQARARELLAGMRIPTRSSVRLASGEVTVRPMRTNFDVARYFTRLNKLDDPTTPQAERAILDALYADVLYALSQSGSAVGWYDAKVKAALANLAILHPELATNEEAKFGFLVMLAITSNGERANANFKFADKLYRQWRSTGVFPTRAPGMLKAGTVGKSLEQVSKLVAEHGWEKLRDFMVSDHAVPDIRAFTGDSSVAPGELTSTTTYGAVFLGSKIGAFFNNLYGRFDPLTMDRWFVRSITRLQGTMLQYGELLGTQLTNLRGQIDTGIDLQGQTAEALHAEIDAYEALPDRSNVEAVLKVLPKVLKYSHDRYNKFSKGEKDAAGVKHSFQPRTRENVLAKTIFENLTLEQQVPNGGQERERFRGIMKALQQKLENGGITIDMADLQAALWYHEKDLFALMLGERRRASLFDDTTVEAEDYETASLRLLDGEGAGAARPGGTAKRVVAERAGPGGTAKRVVAERAGPAAASGEFFQGANPVAVTGTHFSRQGRQRLDGAYYGTGLRGLESERLRDAEDQRLKARVYFYVGEGTGVRPEAGVGGIAHSVPLQNLYDAKGDLQKLWRGSINDIESRILDAGFDGYYIRNAFNGQGAAVVIGDASRNLVATPLPSFERGAPVQSNVPVPYKRGLTSSELGKLDLAPVVALAPSAKLRSGTFQVDASEFAAARDALTAQGIDLPVPVLGQGARGAYSPSKMTISLLETADLTTFLHETGHFMLDAMARVSSLPNAPVQVREDMEKMLAWFGVKDLATWNGMTTDGQRQHHEKFAESFEQYLFEGKAPSRELTPLFQRFSSWMKSVYRSLTEFMRANNTQLSDEVRAVFDRMLATEEQIAQKQEDYNYSAMFSTRPPNMTDDEFADYMLANEMATGEAVDELQARSLRDLRWVLNARSREMKKLEKGVAEKRKLVEAEVRAEVQAQPVYAIQRWLKKGLTPEGTQTEGAKLNTEDLREIFGDGPAAPWRYLATNMVSNIRELSLHPDDVAQLFSELGYTSGEQMVRDIVAAFPEEQSIQGLTDTRVLERFGDIASPQAIEAAANEAVHNEYRARALTTELKAMTQATQPVRVLQAAAKAFADRLIGGRRVKDVKPAEYERAEQRAAKRVGEMGAKGSTQDAVIAKRDQVLQFYAAKSAHQALGDVRKAKELFNKIVTQPDDKAGKTRDMDLVNVTRAILANYGFGGKAKTAHDYLNVLADHDPQTYEAVKDRVIAAELSGKPFAELTVDEMRTLVDEVQSLWLMARRSKQIEVDGKLVSLAEAQKALAARLDELGVPARVPGEGYAVTPGEQRLNMLQTFIASARRVESWISAKDGADVGPFRKYVFNAIKDAADNYRHDRGAYIKRYGALLKSIAPDMKRGMIDAPEIGYLFGKDSGGVGMNELLHALAHTGNASNKRKLLLGRGWATEMPDGSFNTTKWDSFVRRMVAEGRLAKRHYDFVQGVWDMLESTKPQAQKMHRDVFGKYFNEVTADSFATPFGYYRGGYVPAMTDARVVSDKKTRDLAEEDNKTMAFAFPATNKGFTKSRVDYNRELVLDLRTLASHLDKVLLFSHMEGPLRDVRRVLTGKGVAYNLNRVDPTAFDSLLTPWLNRSANQQVETPVAGSAGMMRIFSGARANAGMAAMFANVSNTAQQITGLSIATIRVPPRKLMTAMGQYIANPKDVSDAVAAGSVFMANRMDNEVSAMHNAISEILLDPSPYQKAQAWFSRHAYFMQAAVDNVIGPVVWLAARDDGLSRGMSELDARRHADGVVRTTQGSTLPEDISRIETGNAFVRMFTQFMGYFNMQANTVGTEIVKITDSIGLRAGAGKALYVLLFGALAPAWVAEAIAQAFKGAPGDEDEDGWYIDDWIKAVFGYGTLRTASAAVPVVGQVVNASVNAFNSKPYDDRIGSSPAIGMIESTIRAPVSVYKAILEDGNRQKAVRDAATAISMLTGIPVAGFARPLGYLAGVAQGKTEPESPGDAVRGLLTGVASPDSRQ